MISADESKVALVTGSSSGLGLNLSIALISDGWRVYGLDICPQSLPIDSSSYIHCQCDLSIFTDILKVCQSFLASEKSLDLLVNCAGVMPTSLIARFDPEIAEITYKVNVIAPMYLSKLLLKRLRGSANPKIINVSSIAAELTIPGESIYASSKAALSHLSKIMAIEYARYHIAVHDLRPALIKTPMTEHLTDPQRQEMLKRQAVIDELVPDDFTQSIFGILGMPYQSTGSITYIGGIAS